MKPTLIEGVKGKHLVPLRLIRYKHDDVEIHHIELKDDQPSDCIIENKVD